jgi:hypothetical protein
MKNQVAVVQFHLPEITFYLFYSLIFGECLLVFRLNFSYQGPNFDLYQFCQVLGLRVDQC